MADNTIMNAGTGGDTLASDDIAGIKHARVKIEHGVDGSATDVSTASPLPTVLQTAQAADGAALPTTGVQIGGTDGTLFQTLAMDASGRAQVGVGTALPAGTNAIGKLAANAGVNIGDVGVTSLPAGSQAATTAKTSDYDTGVGVDTVAMQGIALPASGGAVQGGTSTNPVRTDPTGSTTQPVSGTVTATGPLTDAQLRATAVPVSGTVTASGPLTDAQLRATPVPVSGTVTASGPLTDVQLRATAVPVSGTVTANAGTGTFTVDSELPAAAALADAAANPTTPTVGSAGLIFNGTTWDRARGDTTNGLDVDVTRLPALVTGTASIGRVNVEPQTANGLSIFHLVSAASTNATNVKASAGQVYGWYIYNSNAVARKVAFHNTAGTPTAGASVVFSIVIPPTSAANVEFANGLAFGTGIAITTVTELTDAGATAVAASDLVINLFFK